MYNDIIALISKDIKTNDIGDTIKTTTKREVFAKLKSIGQSEFYQANANGLKPEIKFVIADYYDYEDEEEIEYNNCIYQVLRTYRNGNTLEITCYRGVDNGNA